MIPALPIHAAAMAAVHAEVFPEAPWPADHFAVLLGQPGVSGFIDTGGGLLLLRVAADEAEILTIGVTARRRGIGRRLLAQAIASARAAGATAMFLEVAADNKAANALYAGAGFVQVGERRGYYPDGGDALVLRLDI
jgi:ribosomal-protein-alanine N-acetyltransferase